MSELRLFDNEYNCIIAGVDEAGRGPLAGPVVAAAVIIEDYFEELEEINDSKKLTEKNMQNLFQELVELLSGDDRLVSEGKLMKNKVVPYISMRSPGLWASTDSASDQASIVPTVTGTPTGSPVAADASAVTWPATSPAHFRVGNSRPGAIWSAHGRYHWRASMSYKGVDWEADW